MCMLRLIVITNKCKETKTYRKKTPDQHASFLNFDGALEFDLPQTDIHAAFDYFYSVALSLFNQFYPEKTITVSSRDPDYITPEIKAKFRRKNKLMRAIALDNQSFGPIAGSAIAGLGFAECFKRINQRTFNQNSYIIQNYPLIRHKTSRN